MSHRSLNFTARNLMSQAAILAGAVALLWLFELADLLIWQGGLDAYGIVPRTAGGLRHIFIAPLMHAGFAHLLANTVPFVVLGWFVMLRRTSDFFVVTAVAALVSGLGIWLFGGASTIHVGASGVIFGYLGFLLARGYLERSAGAILLALVALFLYGGMIWGVLPTARGVSWLGHLFGFVGGVVAAWLLVEQTPGRRGSIAPG